MQTLEAQSKPQLHEEWIDRHASQIVKTLQSAGFETYLVGGCVRDLLAGIPPKDFDIATNALPQEVRKRVSNSYVIGKRFKLVLAKRFDQQFEIATFRRNASPEELEAEDSPSADNFFGTVVEDAKRRDFTVNSLFYDPVKKNLIDHCEGLRDVTDRWIRMIGDPVERLKEDPIRILRAVRLSHKLCFSLDPELRQAIIDTAGELARSALPRRREEWLKILRLKNPGLAYMELFDLGVMQATLPGIHEILSDEEKRERFLFYLERIQVLEIDKSNPLELFASFALVLLLSYFGEVPAEPEQSKRFEILLKEELGMFKMEMSVFFQALRLLNQLKTPDLFVRKGERRQAAFIRQDGFLLSLALSQLNWDLTPQQLVFWKDQAKRHLQLK